MLICVNIKQKLLGMTRYSHSEKNELRLGLGLNCINNQILFVESSVELIFLRPPLFLFYTAPPLSQAKLSQLSWLSN